MGKVFNDQIIKILCAKNLNKIQNEIGEPNIAQKCSCLRRGESYVVFLDKDHRKQLQRQMGNIDITAVGAESSLCALNNKQQYKDDVDDIVTPGASISAPGGISVENWVNKAIARRRSCVRKQSMRTRIRESLHSLSNLFDAVTKGRISRETIRATPAVYGPFLDEPLIAAADRICYCLFLIMGRELEPFELQDED